MRTLNRWSCIPVHQETADRWSGAVPAESGWTGVGLGAGIFVALAAIGAGWLQVATAGWEFAGAMAIGLASLFGLWLAASAWRSRSQRRQVTLADGMLTVEDLGGGEPVRWSAPTSAFVGVVLWVQPGELPADDRAIIELRHTLDDRTIRLHNRDGDRLGEATRALAVRMAAAFGVDAWVETGAGLERLPSL